MRTTLLHTLLLDRQGLLRRLMP